MSDYMINTGTDEEPNWEWTSDSSSDYDTVNVDDTGFYQSEAETNRLNAAENDAYLESIDAWDPLESMQSVGQASIDSTTDAAGNKVYTYPDNSTVTKDSAGNVTGMTGGETSSSWKDILSALPAKAADAFKRLVVNPDNSLNLANIGFGLKALGTLGLNREANQPGYKVPIPELGMTRQQVMPNDPNRRPGSAGLQYFTDPKYAKLGDAPAQDAAQAADTQQAAGLRAAYTPATAAVNPWAGKMKTSALSAQAVNPMAAAAQAVPEQPLTVPEAQLTGGLKMAQGGLASFAKGGNNYLQGATDGMADKLDTTIDDKQAAKLSHGEFVIPADVVSHLGNGNSEAGAKTLYAMMAKIRKARTGNPEQGKRINPDKFMPGGLAQYATGGVVAFAGPDGSAVQAPATTAPASTSTTDVLSEWAGPTVSGMLSKGVAASNAPYQAYTGPLTAGASDLQQQAFAGASDLAGTGYTPTQFTTSSFDTAAANKYMNPYLQASLDPQLKELQRQSQISNMTNAGKLSQAGAYGGSRQAILQGEENRNLLDKSQDLIGTGYNTAYNKAMDQFNTEQGRGLDAQKASEASRVYGADYGLKSIQNLSDLGATQRGITQEGITADKKQFEEQRDNPMLMAQYQKSLLEGLPITTQNKNINTSDYTNMMSKLTNLEDQLRALGVNP